MFMLPKRICKHFKVTVVVIDVIIVYISALKTKDSNSVLANSVFWL